MKRLTTRTSKLAGALATAALIACGAGGTDSDTSRTIEGRVDSDQPVAAAEGDATLVTAHRVQADGSLQLVSESAAEADAQGRYELQIDADADATGDLLIRAERGSERLGQVAFEAMFDAQGRATAPPIDTTGTVVADVFLSARASGEIDADVPPGHVRLFVDQQLAASLSSSSSYDAHVQQTAQATASAMAAWRMTLTHDAVAVSDSDVSMAYELSAEAEAQLASDLDAAASEQEIDAAIDAYVDALLQAYVDAGIDPAEVTAAAIASSEAMLAYSGEMTSEIDDRMITAAAMVRARLIARAHGSLELTSDLTVQVLANAETTLRAEIEAALDAGAGAETAVQEAWASYRDSVVTALETTFAVTGSVYGEAVTHVESSTSTLESGWASLSASASATANAEISSSAMGDFLIAAMADAQIDALAAAGTTEARATALLEMLALIEACSR